ncbi:unnamed protein product [Dicrocoelium dendriticum]|nr:unnamed protein product [Dicrocoelium dendriticum]
MQQRVARHPTSVCSGEPRIARGTLDSADETEAVLLSAVRLRNSPSGVCILPDLPWKDNPKEAVDQRGVPNRDSKKTIFVHGVPELLHSSDHVARTHDREQWCYIREALSVDNVIAKFLTSVPSSPNYKGCGPRLMKVILHSEGMTQVLLDCWLRFRARMPTGIRLKAAGERPKVGSNSIELANATNSLFAHSCGETDTTASKAHNRTEHSTSETTVQERSIMSCNTTEIHKSKNDEWPAT